MALDSESRSWECDVAESWGLGYEDPSDSVPIISSHLNKCCLIGHCEQVRRNVAEAEDGGTECRPLRKRVGEMESRNGAIA